MSVYSNSWATALKINQVDRVFGCMVVDETDLPQGGSIVMKGNTAYLRFTNPFGGYQDYLLLLRGLSKSDAHREKHNLIDTAGLYGYSYEHGEPLEIVSEDAKRHRYVVGEWFCFKTNRFHDTCRSIADQETRGTIDLERGVMTWDCDKQTEGGPGEYRILAYDVSEEEGEALKAARIAHNIATFGAMKAPRRDSVPHFELQRKTWARRYRTKEASVIQRMKEVI